METNLWINCNWGFKGCKYEEVVINKYFTKLNCWDSEEVRKILFQHEKVRNKANNDAEYISALRVRGYLSNGNYEKAYGLLPKLTKRFLKEH